MSQAPLEFETRDEPETEQPTESVEESAPAPVRLEDVLLEEADHGISLSIDGNPDDVEMAAITAAVTAAVAQETDEADEADEFVMDAWRLAGRYAMVTGRRPVRPADAGTDAWRWAGRTNCSW
ncbi:acyl-CoA carboxylase epsilon subunit [Halobacteriaceae archaeon GCM10025711]